MSIKLKCEHCGKQVQAPDDAGGKHGKCPSCHQTMYIPMPDEQIEPLEIAPLDENDERQREELTREAYSLDRALREEGEVPGELAEAPIPGAGDAAPQVSVRELLIDYALAMVAGDLEQAELLARKIHADFPAAEDVIQSLVADELPPLELSAIPHPVLVGFFKQLSSKK